MNASQILNLIGLTLITFGAIAGALSAPTPQYAADGSISVGPNDSTKEQRTAIHKRQKKFPFFLAAVGVGASLQAIAIFLPASAYG